MHVVEQQRSCITVIQPADGQLGELDEKIVARPRARRADERDPFGEETTGDEPEDLCRGVIPPLRVVDDAYERFLLGDLGEQGQRREAHQEPGGWRAGPEAEYG